MRRSWALIAVAVVVAVGAGLALPADAVKASTSSLSTSQLSDELAAIHASLPYQCYLQAQAYRSSNGTRPAPGLPGVATATWNNQAAVQWTNIRANQLAEIAFVKVHNPGAFSAASLAAARSSLENEIYSTIYAAYNQQLNPSVAFSCPAARGGAATLASLPAWFANDQVEAQAALLGLGALVPHKVPESGPGLEAWFNQHASEFDTLCVAVIAVPDVATAHQVKSAIDAGMSIADAASRWSTDAATRKHGGKLGCYSAKTSSWAFIKQDIGSTPTGKMSIVYTRNGGVFLLGYTSKVPVTYAAVSQVVATAARQRNIEVIQAMAIVVLHNAQVSVSPAVGVWVPSTVGGTLVAPPLPPTTSTANPSANVPPASPLAPQPSGSSPVG